MVIQSSSLPNQSLLRTMDFQYCDSFYVFCPYEGILEITKVVDFFFHSSPQWVNRLFSLRNRIARIIGLKTPDHKSKKINVQVGETIGLFTLYDMNEYEAIMGQNDKHLDFRVSILLERVDKGYHIYISTVVAFHGISGRLYFVPVKPFHKFVSKAILREMVKNISGKSINKSYS
ncbi:DUF2867 domain-containing protein [Halalkalibacter hemicellulosilyticus]|uniref:DUF2867 domain-containing protein n=1 Tax=Halalkalibacter hemicellulosilyticusJCM 9152 TaxID=1236971 RepID=W4QG21_9BACI|nr:DUF2867 domain-containing protein [Halalkalibacter hemicellulosilyticus]GAE31021.1 hypothetical protein JCM9152_2459 [Halalkalibacter hemicellulosilyticusJCM 9152]